MDSPPPRLRLSQLQAVSTRTNADLDAGASPTVRELSESLLSLSAV